VVAPVERPCERGGGVTDRLEAVAAGPGTRRARTDVVRKRELFAVANPFADRLQVVDVFDLVGQPAGAVAGHQGVEGVGAARERGVPRQIRIGVVAAARTPGSREVECRHPHGSVDADHLRGGGGVADRAEAGETARGPAIRADGTGLGRRSDVPVAVVDRAFVLPDEAADVLAASVDGAGRVRIVDRCLGAGVVPDEAAHIAASGDVGGRVRVGNRAFVQTIDV